MNVYESCPIFITPRFTLRLVRQADAEGLLEVYSDPFIHQYINADNCTSDFRYSTIEEMQQCINMWLRAYQQKEYVRWTIFSGKRIIGTVEMFRRDDGEHGEGLGILRIDVKSLYESSDVHEELLRSLLPALHELFHCQRILSKALPVMMRRRLAMVVHGFIPYKKPLIGENGVEYGDYWVRRHNPS